VYCARRRLASRAGEVRFACLVPGHMESGVRGRIKVIG